MSSDQRQLEAAIAVLEAQRSILGDVVVESLLAPARARLGAMKSLAEEAEAARQALRQVTIVFVDVVGSTKLAQHLDPEAISAVMDDALSRGTAVVEAYLGRVLQYAGDSILAAFGAAAAREDDAERAVRCGMALLDLGKALGLEVESSHGRAGFDFRVGIHTGSVLLGGGVDAEGTIRGIAVNIAARMEQTAPPGVLRISHDTYAQVRGLFDVDEQEPLSVKGVDTPIRSYFVRRARPRRFRGSTRGIEGVATRMIGRQAELEALQAAFERLFSERRMESATVVGEPGIGKSRLLYEFEDWTASRPETFCAFRGRATQETGSQAFGLLRDIVARHLNIGIDDSIDAARKKMEEGIVPLFLQDDGPTLAEGHAHLLGYLIGIEWSESRHIKGIRDDPKQIRSRGFHAAAQMFRRVLANPGSPGLLLLEDLHWADGESLDFLRFLATVNHDVPMLVVAFTRPTLFERKADWRVTGGVHSRIDLLPLDETHSVALANDLLKKLPEVPSALRELITASSEGNPFYMEELTKMLIDQGALRTGEVWSVDAERLRVTSVPVTLTSVLQARLDSLPGRERHALQQASIIGAVFWDQALVAVDAPAAERLPALVQRGLTLPRTGTAPDGLREYAFHHQLLHQVTYDTVLRQQRREGHARVGRWLAELGEHGSLRGGDFLGLAAEHFDRAGEGPAACEYYARAATHAAGRFAHDAVLRYAGRAIELTGVDEATDARLMRWRLLDVRERTLDLQGRRPEQKSDVEALEALADALDDDSRRAEAAWRRCDMALRTANFPAMESAARRAVALAEQVGAVSLRLRAQQRLAVSLFMLGDTAAGRAMAENTLAAARELGLRSVQALALNALAAIANEQEDWMAGLRALQEKLQVERDLGNARSTCTTLVNMGALWLDLGQHGRARGHLEEGLQLARGVGDRATECYPLLSLSLLALREDDAAAALSLAQAAHDIAVAMHDPLIEANALCRLGDAQLALGRLEAAEAAFVRAHATASTLKHVRQYDAAAGLARVALAQGDPPRDLAPVQGLIDHLAAGGSLQGTDSRRIRLTGYRWLTQVGDQRAGDVWAAAQAELQAVAAAITDAAVRDGFLENIEEHRQLAAASRVGNRPS